MASYDNYTILGLIAFIFHIGNIQFGRGHNEIK